MPKHVHGEKSEERYADLDKLVLAEIESLTGGRAPGRRRTHRGRMRVVNDQRPEQPAAVDDGSTGDKVVALSGANPETGEFFGEEAAALLEPEDEHGNQGVTPDDVLGAPMEPGAEIFSSEEQAFITRALGFLSGRDNADLILGRVWEQVTAASSPDEFFLPEDEHPAFAPKPQPLPQAEPPPE